MGNDYYNILNVSTNAGAEDLKKAYRKISQAYDKRAIYDRYGEEGLKGHVPPNGDRGEGQARGGGSNVFRSYPGHAENVFTQFFGDPAHSSSVENNLRGGEDVFPEYFRDLTLSGPRKGDPVENKLPCTLEQLYNGSTRKMKISRNILHISGKTLPIEEILTVEVKPGWKKGTKLTFSEKGNEQPNVVAGDLIFVIDEKPHDVYKRDGNDLILTQKITPAQALTGYTVNLVTLDGADSLGRSALEGRIPCGLEA